jgi:hypothetical protein
VKTLLRFALLSCTVAFASSVPAAEPVGKPRLDPAEPAGVKGRVQGAAPCCNITAINMKTGVVTMKDSKTGQLTHITVKSKANLARLRIGQQVGKNL